MTNQETPVATVAEDEATIALVERLHHDAIGALELYTVYLGEQLGLYRALAAMGSATSTELATDTGTTERLVREWLEHHASSGLITRRRRDGGAARTLLPAPARAHPRPRGSRQRLLRRPSRVETFSAPGAACRSWQRSSGAAAGLPPLPPRWSAALGTSIGLSTSTCWARLGLPAIADVDRRLHAGPPARWPTSPVAPDGQASRWPWPTRPSPSTGSISSPGASPRRSGTPKRSAWPNG